jgi:hypothetical protein
MKYISALLIFGSLLAGCVSSSPPPPPARTTVVVPPSQPVVVPPSNNVVVEPGTGTGTTVVCQNGGSPPCY